MSSHEKPPLGAGPSWFTIPNRNKELADAISRYSDRSEKYYTLDGLKVIKEWAIEIAGNCDTGMKILEVEKNCH